jgi:hypothetical protein
MISNREILFQGNYMSHYQNCFMLCYQFQEYFVRVTSRLRSWDLFLSSCHIYYHVLASNLTNNSYNAYLEICLFGLSLAELQLLTSQLITHKPVTCLLVLNCGLLRTELLHTEHSYWNWKLSSYWLLLNWTALSEFSALTHWYRLLSLR